MTQAELNTPSRSTPLCMPLTWAMDWLSSSLLLSIWRMDGSRLSAAAVMVTPLLVRVNSRNPHSDSMPETAWLMAEGVKCILLRRRGKGAQLGHRHKNLAICQGHKRLLLT